MLPEPGDERAQKQLLRKAHARVRRHFKTPELDKTEAARRTVRGIELVDADFRPVRVAGDIDQKIAQQPVKQPRERSGTLAGTVDLGKGNLQFVKPVVAGFVHARGPGRSGR